MAGYRIGALSQLISSNTEGKGGEIDDLFKASPCPVDEVPVEEVKPEKIEDSVQTHGKSPKKKKKRSKKDKANEAIENEVKSEVNHFLKSSIGSHLVCWDPKPAAKMNSPF